MGFSLLYITGSARTGVANFTPGPETHYEKGLFMLVQLYFSPLDGIIFSWSLCLKRHTVGYTVHCPTIHLCIVSNNLFPLEYQ